MFRKLAIGMTDVCSAACDMCCFGCSPKGKNTLEVDLMKDAIRQASESEDMRAVGFTGGEPFMIFDKLVECSRYAKSLGLRITVNTNGFWGRNEKKAREMVETLKEAGVERFSFSADRYHQEFIPIEDLKTALRVTYAAGLQSEVSIMETKGSDDIVQMTEALRPEVYQTTISNHPMLPVGSALEHVKEGDFIRLFESKDARCPFFGLVQLNFDGNYYMCCSQFCKEIPKLKLGNAKEVKLKDLDRAVSSDDYLYVMLRKGLFWFIALAKKKGFEIPQYLCSACHCCYFVFRNQELLDAIKEEVTEEAGRLRIQHILGGK